MDTGSYMANQMDDQITGSLAAYEEFLDTLFADMDAFIKKSGWTWQVKDIFDEYKKYSTGVYVSFTARQIITKFEDRLKLTL
jgi:hypothetical protein